VFKHLNLIEEGQPFIQAILSGHATAVSVGSFKDGQGTAVWMMYNMQNPKISSGYDILTTPGATWSQGLYQSKLSGIYGIITMINALATYY